MLKNGVLLELLKKGANNGSGLPFVIWQT